MRAITPDRAIDGATIEVENGTIVAIHASSSARIETGVQVIDGRGLTAIPGLVDLHSDGLEAECGPRADAVLPPQFAFRAYTSRLIAAGITTVFHGVGFRSRSAIGAARPVGLTETMLQLLSEPSDPRIDHRMLARLDVLDEQAWRNLHEAIARRRNSTPILLSLEDHTPGRGQYRDLAHLERRLRLDEGLSRDEANVRVASLLERGDRLARTRDRTLAAVRRLIADAGGDVIGIAHDAGTVDDLDVARACGATVVEFPTTLEAARSARARGMRVLVGGPNIVRGTSHCGNVSALDVAEAGLVDGLVSDYAPASLLGAVGRLVLDGVSWWEAVALATSGPAAIAGLEDRGRIEVGARADLVLVDARELPWLVPHWVTTAGGVGRIPTLL